MSSLGQDHGLRLMVFDKTCTGKGLRPGLSHAWRAGAVLYHGLGRIDAWRGVSSWEEAFVWLAGYMPERKIAQVQYWGHGKWGLARVDKQRFDIRALRRRHSLKGHIEALAKRMLPEERGLWWFRTCETFGAKSGHVFASALAENLGCTIAGHTFIISHWQSGLHSLRPGQLPHWPDDEALCAGTPEAPREARWSRPWAPNTINFLQGTIPQDY